jgi:hypothetical protein
VFYVTPDLRYNLTEKLAVNCSYQYGWRYDPVETRSVDRHVVWLSLSYAYPLHQRK